MNQHDGEMTGGRNPAKRVRFFIDHSLSDEQILERIWRIVEGHSASSDEAHAPNGDPEQLA